MQVFDFLKEAILSLTDFDEDALSPDSALEDISLDSLDYVEIQVGLKKNFGVQPDGEYLASGKIKTLGELCAYIDSLRSAAPSGAAA